VVTAAIYKLIQGKSVMLGTAIAKMIVETNVYCPHAQIHQIQMATVYQTDAMIGQM
jgi:hypothetical protein